MTVPAPEAASVLVEGSALSGQRQAVHRFLRERDGTPLVVSTRQPAESARRTYRRVIGQESAATDEAPAGTSEEPVPFVVDCVTGTVEGFPPDESHTKYAQHPSDLTSIGTKLTEFFEAHNNGALAVGIDTLSPPLMYTDSSTVCQFLHVVVQKAIAADCPLVAALDDSAHDDRVVAQLVQMFEAVVETRRVANTREIRVARPEPTEWQEL